MKKNLINNPLRSNTRFYHIWENMKKRCDNPKHNRYKYYGGKGITYKLSWSNFKNFARDMFFSYKDGLTLDRIDNNKGYSKDNCRWATYNEQNNNRTNTHKRFDFLGISDTLDNWSNFFGFNIHVLQWRLYKGKWSVERILTERNPYYGETK